MSENKLNTSSPAGGDIISEGCLGYQPSKSPVPSPTQQTQIASSTQQSQVPTPTQSSSSTSQGNTGSK